MNADRKSKFGAWELFTVAVGLVLLWLLFDWGKPHAQVIKWGGHKDLEIIFSVIDRETGQPLQGAKVEILEEDASSCADRGKAPFVLSTDLEGKARHLSKYCRCGGTSGGGKDDFAIDIPGWLVRVSAPGYSGIDNFYLDTPENQRLVRRGKDFASLEVQIQLSAAPAASKSETSQK